MKFINLLVVALLTLLTANAYAQGQPKYVDEGTIKIDGSSSDWSGVTNIFSDFGGKSPSGDFVDVKVTKLAYNKSSLYFSIDTNKQLNSWTPKSDISVFQIYFDVDAEQATGSSKLKAYDVATIMGYEFRLEVIIQKRGKAQARLYSKMDGFKKKVARWVPENSFKCSGSNMEFQIPLDILNIPASGIRKVRFLFAEFANSKTAAGYSKIVYTLDFNKAAEAVTAATEESSGGSSGGFGIWQLMVITIWIVCMLCAFAIVPKAGLSTGMALVNIIPFFGQLAFLFILAFNQWPLHKDYNALENRLKKLESQDEY